MRTFLINLDVNKDRMSFVDAQLRRCGMVYERIPGVDGAVMPLAERKKCVNRFRWWCAVGRPATAAEIGCALSHYCIYKRMIDEKIPTALIFEDDVLLSDVIKSGVRVAEKFLSGATPQVLLFSNHDGMPYERMGVAAFVENGITVMRSRSGICADGYCLNLEAAKALLRQNFPMIVPCDHWWRWVSNGTIELYHVLPSAVVQNQCKFGSSTSMERLKTLTPMSAKWFLHKAKRLAGKPLDWLMSGIFDK